MFIRTKTTPNSPRKSIQIVESIREGKKVKQKIIRHVGIAMNQQEERKLYELAEHIKAQLLEESQASIFGAEKMAELAIQYRRKKWEEEEQKEQESMHIHLEQFEEESRNTIGVHEVYGQVYSDIGFDRAIPNPRRNQSANKILKHIVMARISNPQSKRASVESLYQDFGVNIALEKVYRLMDKMDDKCIKRIQDLAFSNTSSMLGGKVNVVFYDCTTLYFESFTQDELKQNGFSKDRKFNQPQVLLGLFVTEEGLPLGYNLFPGATFEGHTLKPVLEEIGEKFDVEEVVFVADSAMLSKENRDYLQSQGYKYIVAARLKNMDKKTTAKFLDESTYEKFCQDTQVTDLSLDSESRLIVTRSSKRARKDASDRQVQINKLKTKLQKSKRVKSHMGGVGYKRFLKISSNSAIEIDQKKIKEAERFDGLHGVITNLDKHKYGAGFILDHYRGLWQIEESFRIQKHDLRIRPIYHWTPSRVEAHIAISFMAFCCVRHLTYRVGLQYKKLSPRAIKNALNSVQLSIIKHKERNERYAIPSRITTNIKKIYNCVGLKISSTPFPLILPG